MRQILTSTRNAPVFRMLAILMLATMVLAPMAPHAVAQDDPVEAKPTQDPALQPNDPTAPQPNDEETPAATEPADAQPTPEPEEGEEQSGGDEPRVTRSSQQSSPATGPGSPAVLAHGLAYLNGDEVVWQVRETDMPPVDEAESTTSEEAIMLQREGASIVRNDVTGKRAKMDPGEAYFRAAGDGYTVMAEDDTSVVWTFELVQPDNVAMDAFYESPRIDTIDEGVYDMMLTRYVLAPGDEVELPEHSGAGLVMPTAGEVEVDADGQRSALEPGDGQTIEDTATLSNTSDNETVLVYVYLGDEVSDASAGTGTAQEPADSSGETSGTEETATATDAESGSADSGEADTLQEEADASDGSTDTPATDDAGNYITSIDVTANVEIYLVITVDGLTVFDGNLPAGASSGPVVGTNFTVYTSSGANTVFTNACGETFYMGYEEGEATYTLTATEQSCAP